MAITYADLLTKLGARMPPTFIMGGYAEDALLSGKTTRPHDDVDVIVVREDLDAWLHDFHAWGFEDFDLFLSDPSGNPTVLNCRTGDVALELCIGDRDSDGNFYYDLEGPGNETGHRVYLPEDAFAYPPSTVDGISVRTVSPLTLYQVRAALDILQSFGPMREKDIVAQSALKQRFFLDKTDAELRPRIEKMS